MKKTESIINKVAIALGCILTIFQIFTASVRTLPGMEQRSIHLAFGLALVFLLNPVFKKSERKGFRIFGICLSVALAIAAMVSCFYAFFNWKDMAEVVRMIKPHRVDLIMGTILLALVLLGTYRKLGIAMPLIALIFLLYARYGQFWPALLRHADVPFPKIIALGYMSTEGIFSSTLGVSSTQVYIFLLFGQLLETLGGGEFFLNLANCAFGKLRGGPAKVAVFASALFGSISGSAVANVAGTGTITVPMMKKVGYTSRFSGAVVAVAATGGLIMPPVMGAAAFCMAETIGCSYWQVCVAAIFPALLYYLAVFITVDFRAGSLGLQGLPESEIPKFKDTMKDGGLIFLPPLIVLIVALAVFQISCGRACFYCCCLLVALALFKKDLREKLFHNIADILFGTAKSSLTVIMACACAGVVLLGLQSSGLILKISNIMISLANGNLIVLGILIMITSIILGMGLPASACYVVLAILAAPSLVQLGVPKMAAHLFVLYFGAMSAITPPVAMAAFAAGPIADESSVKIGYSAWYIALPSFLIAFCMILQPELCLIGNFGDIVVTIVFCIAGVTCMAIGLQGYVNYQLPIWRRIFWSIAGVLLIMPQLSTSLCGTAIAIVMVLTDKHIRLFKKNSVQV